METIADAARRETPTGSHIRTICATSLLAVRIRTDSPICSALGTRAKWFLRVRYLKHMIITLMARNIAEALNQNMHKQTTELVPQPEGLR